MQNSNNNIVQPRREKQKGTGFTNVNRIIDANKGNQLGSNISQNLQNQGQQTQQAVQGAVSRFSTELNKNKLGEQDQQNRDNTVNQIEQGQGSANEQNIQDFGRYRAGTYQGPTNLGDTKELMTRAQSNESLAKSVDTHGGRQGILQQFNATPLYTQGTLNTDALLLGQSAPQLQQAAGALRGAIRDIRSAESTAQALGSQAKLDNAQFARDTESLLSKALERSLTPIEQAQSDARTKLDTDGSSFNTLKTYMNDILRNGLDLASLPMGSEAFNSAGITPDMFKTMQKQYNDLIGAGLSQKAAADSITTSMYQNLPDASTVDNIGSFMNQADVNKINSLEKLSGLGGTEYNDLDTYDAGGIGRKNESLIENIVKERNTINKAVNDATYNRNLAQHNVTHNDAARKGLLELSHSGGNVASNGYFNYLKTIPNSSLQGILNNIQTLNNQYRTERDASKRQRLHQQIINLTNQTTQYATSHLSNMNNKLNTESAKLNQSHLQGLDQYIKHMNSLGNVEIF